MDHFAPNACASSQERGGGHSMRGTVPHIGAGRVIQRSLSMILDIVLHTPLRVWFILTVLVALGLSQTRPRELSLMRVTVLPGVLLALSLGGLVNAFGAMPLALGAWLAGVTAALLLPRSMLLARGAKWSASTDRLHVPGSWLPLLVILGSFVIKYVAGAGLAIQPGLAVDAAFAGACSLGFGSFSGLFLGRSLALRSLASRPSTQPLASASACLPQG
jgi:hypothetical protein